MDLDIMREMKFGPETVWEIKYKCGWCAKPINTQDENRYKAFGNCCGACNTFYGNKAITEYTEREVTQTERLIRQSRWEMDLLSLELDKPISEERRVEIVNKMEQKFIKIKLLKGI